MLTSHHPNSGALGVGNPREVRPSGRPACDGLMFSRPDSNPSNIPLADFTPLGEIRIA